MSATEHNVKIARLRVCGFCRHWRNCTQWPWPECHYKVSDGQTIDLAEANRVVLDDQFFDGPAGNCPAGKFEGLAPIDWDAEQEADYLATGERFKAMFQPFRERVGDEQFKIMILELVAANALSQRQVEAMFTVMGIPLDA